MQLRDDEVFLAHDPGCEVLKFDALPAVEFGEALFDLLADDAIHFDPVFPVKEIEK